MAKQFEDIFNQLQYASPVKAKQILRELEVSPEQLITFCRYARKVSTVRAEAIARMLGGMSNPEYMQLLKDYALSSEESLREAAFSALSKGNDTARKEVMLELLKSDVSEIKQRACSLLDIEGDPEVEVTLCLLLADSDVEVVKTALKKLELTVNSDVLRRCEKLLSSQDTEVRILALKILNNADDKTFNYKLVAGCLQQYGDERLRVEACRILAQKCPKRAGELFIEIFNDVSNSLLLRLQAIRAIGQVGGRMAARTLFGIVVAEGTPVSLVSETRKVLGSFKGELLLELIEKYYPESNVLQRFEMIRVLGMFVEPQIEEYLNRIIHIETNQVVLAAVIEQLAMYDDLGIWDFVLSNVIKTDKVTVAYNAAQSAAKLLIPVKLKEFAAVLQTEPSLLIAEVVLKRLAVYGRDHGLCADIAVMIRPYLSSPNPVVRMFAVEAAGYVENAVLVPEMLDLIGDSGDSEFMRELTQSVFRAVSGSLEILIELAGIGRLKNLSALISRVDNNDIRGGFTAFFSYLARNAESKIPGASLVLTIAAGRFYREFVAALDDVGDKELAFLLYTWSNQPEGIRKRCPYNWSEALNNPRIAVRVAALRAMTDDDISEYISDISDIAFVDSKSEVREAAARALRRVLNVQN